MNRARRCFFMAVGFVAALSASVNPAFAGRHERDKQKEEEAKIEIEKNAIKKLCGCVGPKIVVDWQSYLGPTNKRKEEYRYIDMGHCAYGVHSLTIAVEKQCKDKEGKAAYCKGTEGMVYKVQFEEGGGWRVSADQKTMICGTDEYGTCDQASVQAALDKL